LFTVVALDAVVVVVAAAVAVVAAAVVVVAAAVAAVAVDVTIQRWCHETEEWVSVGGAMRDRRVGSGWCDERRVGVCGWCELGYYGEKNYYYY
jgi:hypothetical protein